MNFADTRFDYADDGEGQPSIRPSKRPKEKLELSDSEDDVQSQSRIP